MNSEYRILQEAADITPEILKEIESCLDWFHDEPLRTEEFIDRLATTYLNIDMIDIERYDNPAARKIMREARRMRKESEQ